MNLDSSSASNPPGLFTLHPLGYIQHWLVAGPHLTRYEGPPRSEDILRREALDSGLVDPPSSADLNGVGPFGEPWRMYDPGENFFVEFSAFHSRLVVLDSYAFTEIESTRDLTVRARLWVAGDADLWVNDSHLTRFNVGRYMFPHSQEVNLSLRRGVNRLCVRLQVFGVRDTRTLFGLRLEEAEGKGLVVRVPGCAQLVDPVKWLKGIQSEGRDAIVSRNPAPVKASVVVPGGSPLSWPAGSSRLLLGAARPVRLSVEIAAGCQTLRRSLEIPANRNTLAMQIPDDLRTARLNFIAHTMTSGNGVLSGREAHLPLLARRLLDRNSEIESSALVSVLGVIDRREDCADFALATLLRFVALDLASADESAKIQRTALAFRYWDDEPGNDAMCFWSENHSLLFHGCQMLAGRLYPDCVFNNSNRLGSVQATLGATRCRDWLARIEPRGLEEFNSGTYLPITIGALLNVVDFSADAELSQRASTLIDRLYEGLAIHAFAGVVVSPQGRVYRNVLYPGESGTQALLSDAAPEARPDFLNFSLEFPPDSLSGNWIVYPASSPNYRPPAHLEGLMTDSISKRYRQAEVEIVLHKTSDFLLTSLAIPASTAGVGETKPSPFQPGRAGYQQHLWQATLGPDCHVFVNHPGGSFEESLSRPGYWYGNGVFPRLCQREGVLGAIYNIPDGSEVAKNPMPLDNPWPPGAWANPFEKHPIPFSHVHWPSDAFDREETHEHWLFGQKNGGCIALWCSTPLETHNEMMTGREFRAWAYRSAWVAICGGIAESGTFESFIASCIAREPEFDCGALTLRMKGAEPIFWNS